MGRRRDLVAGGISAFVVVGAVAWAVWVSGLPPHERSEALRVAGFVISLTLAVITILTSVNRLRRPPEPRDLHVLTDSLAQAVQSQWRKAANDRSLLTPAPLPTRWSISTLPIAGPVAAAIGAPDAPPTFPPLPGFARSREDELRAGGSRHGIHALFAGLASGRLIITGEPGVGKSGIANLLLLDALTHRERLPDEERHRVPVPVLLDAVGWDPTSYSVQKWLSMQLTATYPLLQRRGGHVEAMSLLASQDRIALILDGLDEMEELLRPAALAALADAPFRVVVLSRRQEMMQAARTAWLVGAAAIDLHNIEGPVAADYLEQSLRGPPPTRWGDLLTQLRYGDRVLVPGLSTPLTLTLVRDTYHVRDDVGELLDRKRFDSPHSIQQHLIARILPDAYTSRPGRSPPRYSLAQARHGLTFFAKRMAQEGMIDLAWWHVLKWASTTPRVAVTLLLFAMTFALAHVIVGRGFSELFLATFVPGFVLGSVLGAPFAIPFGRGGEPRRFQIGAWRTMVSAHRFRQALGIAVACGVLVGATFAAATWLLGSSYVILYGTTIGLAAASAAVMFAIFAFGEPSEHSPLTPRETWRNERSIGLLTGAVTGTVAGVTLGFTIAPGFYAEVALVFGLAFFTTFGLASSKTWPANLAWIQLIIRRRVPAVSLTSYLEYARNRGVLRLAGGVYQFRHVMLQDQLAEQALATSSPAVVSRQS